jgi:FixJ family two-component response regulator
VLPSQLTNSLEQFSEAKIIVIAGEQNIRSVVRAVRAGADDYLMLPIEKVELELIIEKANESAIQAAQIRHLEKMVLREKPRLNGSDLKRPDD